MILLILKQRWSKKLKSKRSKSKKKSKMILLTLKHLGSYIKISLRQAEWDSKYYHEKEFWVHVSKIKQTTDKFLDEGMLFCGKNSYFIPWTVYYNSIDIYCSLHDYLDSCSCCYKCRLRRWRPCSFCFVFIKR